METNLQWNTVNKNEYIFLKFRSCLIIAVLYKLYYCQRFSTNNLYFYIFICLNHTSVMVPTATCIFKFDNNLHFEGVKFICGLHLTIIGPERSKGRSNDEIRAANVSYARIMNITITITHFL